MRRDRLTITLDNELVETIDRLVDKEVLRNRSQAIEHFLKEGLGYHQLRQAFLFFEAAWDQPVLEKLVRLFAESSIRTLYVCLEAGQEHRLADIQALIHSQSVKDGSFSILPTPSDFGSGGAVMLRQKELHHPFLLAWVNPRLVLPESLLPLFVFHHQHNLALTRCLAAGSDDTAVWSQLALAGPSVLGQVPAGQASLVDDVFPQLVKAGTVGGYLFPSP